jgi:AraC family transcriptional regulator
MARLALPSGKFLGATVRARQFAYARLIESRYSAGAVLSAHSHARAHFCFVLSGVYDEVVRGRTRSRERKGLTFLPAASEHAESHHADGRHFLVELDHAPLGAFDLVRGIETPMEMSGPEAYDLAARLHAEFVALDALPPGAELDSTSSLSLECLVVELAAEAGRAHRPRARARPARWLERSLAHLHERFDEPIGLAELARAADVHPGHLAVRFRSRYGLSPGECQRRLRVRFACERLRRTNDPLADIAYAAGFCDQSHMCHAFRRELGVTPGAYRRASR